MKTILSLFLGVVLIVAGTVVLTYQGITLTTAERQLLNLGPLQAGTQESNWTIAATDSWGCVAGRWNPARLRRGHCEARSEARDQGAKGVIEASVGGAEAAMMESILTGLKYYVS